MDPHRIPLCLAAGPSLQLGPDDGATRGLLVDLIVHERHHAHADLHQAQDADRQTTWFANGDVQSRVGILARVRRLHLPSNRCDYEYPIVTELLFYASCSDHPESRLLAPTRSSNMFQLWALPLSSERLPHLATLGPRETVVHQRTAEQASTHPAGKTKLSDLFDNASEQRKKARRRGDASNGSFSVTGLLHAQVQPPASDHATKPIAEAQRLGTAIVKAPKRPAVTQIVSATPDSFQDQSIEARNKQAISRTVMACMRVYGMQQRRARVKAGPAKVGESQTSIDDPDMVGDDERDLEYKAVYHQTYKGTLFAFVSEGFILNEQWVVQGQVTNST